MTKFSAATHTLPAPVVVGGITYSEITLSRPRTGEIRKLHRTGAFAKLLAIGEKAEKAGDTDEDNVEMLSIYDDIVPLLAVLARVDEAVIDALETTDTNKLIAMLEQVDFLPL